MNQISIQFNNINLSSVSSNAGVFSGENNQSNWTLNLKANTGLGHIIGENNLAKNNINIVHDDDFIDADFSQSSGAD